MPWLKLVRRAGGTVLFTAGIFSLLLPVIPGWLLIVLGLYVLSIDSPWLQAHFERLCAQYEWLDKIHIRCRGFFLRTPTDGSE